MQNDFGGAYPVWYHRFTRLITSHASCTRTFVCHFDVKQNALTNDQRAETVANDVGPVREHTAIFVISPDESPAVIEFRNGSSHLVAVDSAGLNSRVSIRAHSAESERD